MYAEALRIERHIGETFIMYGPTRTETGDNSDKRTVRTLM